MYADHYGLKDAPFQLTPDARYYFDSATHRKAMAYLGFGLAQGEGFIVITGDVGAGKSTLVAHLTDTVDASRLTVVKLVSTQVEGDDVLRLAAHALGLATEGLAKAQVLDRIERALLDAARQGRRTLLIVDEAQNLSISALEELRMLSNFQTGGQSLVQIFLLGQPEFRAALTGSDRLEQLRQRVIATHHLTPMTAEEVAPYLRHRLMRAGWTGNPAFTDDAFAAFARWSGGLPRKLNMLAGRVMLKGAMESTETIDGDTVEAVIADMAADMPVAAGPAAEPDAAPQRLSFGRGRGVEAEPLAQSFPMPDPAIAGRLSAIEARLDEQERALRRVLTLLVDWVEGDEARPRGVAISARSSAA